MFTDQVPRNMSPVKIYKMCKEKGHLQKQSDWQWFQILEGSHLNYKMSMFNMYKDINKRPEDKSEEQGITKKKRQNILKFWQRKKE